MNSLTYNLERDCVNSLGIPVDNLTLESAVKRIVQMAHTRDGRARLVSTLNVDFLVNSLGTALTKPRHPELLEVLRSSDLVTADGFPIVWLSRLLGRPLSGRVCGSDLVPALAERCVREKLSIYLLGGGDGVAARAAKVLTDRYPGLRIAGASAPMVQTSGKGLAQVVEDDRRVREDIHASGADILLVGLGNPKQELWFNRNREHLSTPVSIGVGGSFEFITGTVRRAPRLWQKLNMEWLYRITQDPARLWRRYAKGLVKLALLASPVLWSRLQEDLSLWKPAPGDAPKWQTLWSSRNQSISLLTLPAGVDANNLRAGLQGLEADGTGEKLHIIDFSRVRHISLNAQPLFFSLASLLREHPGRIQLMGVSTRVRRQLTTARLVDLLDGDGNGALARLTNRPDGNGAFGCQTYVLDNTTLVSLAGRVTGEALRELGFVECLLDSARQRPCILDLRNVDLLESSGIAELLPLLGPRAHDQGPVFLSGVGHNIQQMLRMADVEIGAKTINDHKLLERIRQEQNHD